jgi:CrcB protein
VSEKLPIDSDVDLHVRAQRFEYLRAPRSVLAAVSAGGAIGAACRWALGVAFPASPSGFPWATFAINVSGGLLIGILMVLVTEVFTGRRLLRPFLGVGVLGGYTTFSTYVVDIQRLFAGGSGRTGLLYLGATALAAVAAAQAGITGARLALRGRRPAEEPA